MKILYKNKKAYHDYEILEEMIAGIVLTGAEIKSVRAGNINLKGAYVSIQGGEAFLKGASIARYRYDCAIDYDPFRIRKLLLKKQEMAKMAAKLNTKGLTVAALAVGLEKAFAKVVIGLVRGKKDWDKRRDIKERITRREAERAIRARQ